MRSYIIYDDICVWIDLASWGSSTCHRSCWYSYSHWIRPLHVNNCLVQLSYQIWPQKTTEGSPDCWANHWYTLPSLPELYSSRESKRSGPLTSSTLPLWTVTVWSTLQSSEHQNDQTQEQFLPSGNPSHEHLTISMLHTLFLHLSI